MIKHPTNASRQLFIFDGFSYSCPVDYDVTAITREDIRFDCNVRPADWTIEIVQGAFEANVYQQIGRVEIDDQTFGVCATNHLDNVAICVDGHPSETVYLPDNIHTDEDREAERAMVAAGWWSA